MKQLAIAIALASEVFKDKLDKGGRPYILHCIHVMNGADPEDEEEMIASILHDVPEDIPEYDIKKLRSLGFSENVLTIIDLLTHKPKDTYEDYIKKISTHKKATKIKKRDLEHNCLLTRIKGIRKKDFERTEKYIKSYLYLS